MIASGDQEAYKLIYERYWDRIYYNALKFLKSPESAQDISQEIFERIWIKRAYLKDVVRFDAFLFTVAKRTILNALKRQLVPGNQSEFLIAFLIDQQDATVHQLETKELAIHLEEAIQTLPAQMRTAFVLSRSEGLTHAEIAVKMNISKVSSQAYIVRALIVIRKHLSEKGIQLIILAKFWL